MSPRLARRRGAWLLLLAALGGGPVLAQPSDGAPQLVSVNCIWNAAPHNAFTDLARHAGKWFCTFREAPAHVGGQGKIRVLTSADGRQWDSAAMLSEEGIDLRDPKFSLAPDGRLMLVLGGSVYEGRVFKERQPRVAFSPDGRTWTAPRRVLGKNDWLWRVTWHQNRAYGIAYNIAGSLLPTNKWRITLVASPDGVDWRPVAKLAVPGRLNEATIRFLANDDCIALVRREGLAPDQDKDAWIGQSAPPYTDWRWHSAGRQIGGPNFLVLPDGTMIAGGRLYQSKPATDKTFIGRMNGESVRAELILPSGGDCSYPGLVWHDGLLWTSYYSSHEGQTSIYLAKVRLPGQSR